MTNMTKEEAIDCLNYQNEKFFGGQSEALKMGISALENKREWIPVSERLPEMGQYVLCSLNFADYRIVIASYNSQEWWCYVEAWQPLPEPYKENEA